MFNVIYMYIYAAEDKDGGDFDKPNIATQAELGTCTWIYTFFQMVLEFSSSMVFVD